MTETEIQNILEKQHKFFQTGQTLPVAYRIEQLQKLRFYPPPRTGSESCLKSRPWKKRDGKLYV